MPVHTTVSKGGGGGASSGLTVVGGRSSKQHERGEHEAREIASREKGGEGGRERERGSTK